MKPVPFEIEHNDKIIRGIYQLPDLNCKHVVIILHGFTGDMNGPKYLLKDMQTILVKNGYGCIRFDYIGCGNSDGIFIDNTITTSISDAKMVIDYCKTKLNNPSISLIGYSMGGLVATQYSLLYPNDIKNIILWAPAFNFSDFITEVYNNSPIISDDSVDFYGVEISRQLVEDAKQYHEINVTNLSVPVGVVHGKNDELINLDIVLSYYSRIPKTKKIKIIDGANHAFDQVKYRRMLYDFSVNELKKA